MLNKIGNAVSFGALKYAPGDTERIVKDEFNTPVLKQAAQDTFERISKASDEAGIDLVLTAEDLQATEEMPSARFIEIQDLHDFLSTGGDTDCLDAYGNGMNEDCRSCTETEKIAELARLEQSITAELQEKPPSIESSLKDFKELFA